MHQEPSWHTVINADLTAVMVASTTFKVGVRPHLRWDGEDPVFDLVFLPRIHVRYSVDLSKANQALLDSEWTWSHCLWGESETLAPPDWYKPWMGARIREIWRLWEEGNQFVGIFRRYDRGWRDDGTYWDLDKEDILLLEDDE